MTTHEWTPTMQIKAERNCPDCGDTMEVGPHPERRTFHKPDADEPPFFCCPNCGAWAEIPCLSATQWTPTTNGESVATIQGVKIITDGQGKYRPAAVWPPTWCDDLHTAVDVGRRLLDAFDVVARFKRGEK